jgi:hypothetical protein
MSLSKTVTRGEVALMIPEVRIGKRTVGDLLMRLTTLQVGIVFVGKGLSSSIDHLLAVLLELLVVDGNLGGSEGRSSDKLL